MQAFASIQTDWATWYSQHPDSQVLSKEITREQFQRGTYAEAPRSSYYVDPYESYYLQPDESIVNRNIPRDDSSLLPKTKVLVVRTPNTTKAYPNSILNEHPVLNDEIGGVPIVIWFDPESQTGRAFERRVGGQVLVFAGNLQDSDTIVDESTGTRWNPIAGDAIVGQLAGESLRALIVTPVFEFGWSDYFPDSTIYDE